MKTKKSKLMVLILCFLMVVVGGSIGSSVFAQIDGCPDASGNCDITGEYQINSSTVLRIEDNLFGVPEDIYIGFNAGALNPKSSGYGSVIIGDSAGSELQDYSFTYHCGTGGPVANVRGTTLIGDEAGRHLPHSMHNTIIGARANGLVCGPFGAVACPSDQTPENIYKPSYSTVVGGLAGSQNIGHGNTFLGVESGADVTTGDANVLLGLNAGAGHERGDGRKSIETGSFNIFIGEDTEADRGDISSSIAIGSLARVEDDYQIVVGSGQFYKKCTTTYDPTCPEKTTKTCVNQASCNTGGDPDVTCEYYDWGLFTESYWGSGVQSIDPQPFRFNASGGEGTDIMGANLMLAGGKGTGLADGGYIVLQTSPAGASSGTVQNPLQDRVIIAPNGNVGIGPGIPNTKLDIQGYNDKRTLTVNATLDQDGVVAGNFIEGAVYSASLSGSSTGYVFGMRGTSVLENTAPTAGLLVGAAFTSQIGNTTTPGTTTADEVIGFQYTLNRHFNNQRTYNITNSYGIQSKIGGGSASGAPVNITNHYHHLIDDPGTLSNVNITNLSGMWIDKQTAGSNNYGIVLDGDGDGPTGDLGAAIVLGAAQNAHIYGKSDGVYVHDGVAETKISPHDPETGEWIFYSKNTKTGRTVRVNMEELVRDMEKLTGKKYLIESFVKDK